MSSCVCALHFLCVDCSLFPVFCIFSIERDSRSRRVRCEDRRHRWTTLEYDRQVNHLLPRSSIFFCALPTKARANLTFLAYLILPKYFIHHNIAFDSNVNFWSMYRVSYQLHDPYTITCFPPINHRLLCWPELINNCCIYA